MIEVKTIAKKRQTGAAPTAGRAGSGFAGSVSAGSVSHAAEADHALRADWAASAVVAGRADKAGTADEARHALDADHALEADEAQHAAFAHDLDADSPVYDRVLRKDRDDATPHALKVGGRLTVATEAGSESFDPDILTGNGWRIQQGDAGAHVWADSLTLRRFLEVPELRYNRTEVIVGNQWQAPGAGIVESYAHLGTSKADDNGDGKESDCNIGVITLKLEDGELGSLSEGDLCMGIWHFGNTGDATADSDDGKGEFHFAGFTTVYFIVYKVEGDRRETLSIRTREEWPAEPAAGMHFVDFGNRKWNYDKNAWEYPDRQKSAYRTRTYERFLVNVNDWTFGEDNIAMQFGDLTNLTIAGTNMAGYSAYLNNIYMRGVLRQLDNTPFKGEKGDKGNKGDKGDKGDKGADGADGAPGRDAVTYEWNATPGAIRCSSNGEARGGTIKVGCTMVKGDTRTPLTGAIGGLLPKMQFRSIDSEGETQWAAFSGSVELDDERPPYYPRYMFRVISPLASVGGEPTVLSEF